MAYLSEIQTTLWSKSLMGYGVVVTGLDCIKQRMDLAIRTGKGTSALRPLFGTDIYKYQDKPVNIVVPNVKNEILRAIMLYVPEVKIKKINHTIYNGAVTFEVIALLLIDLSEFVYVYNPTTTIGTTTNLALQGAFPDNPNGFSYGISIVLNGNEMLPAAPAIGFGSWSETFIWVKNNWGYLGMWALTATGLILYVKDKQYTSGQISIGLKTTYKITTTIPYLSLGEAYEIKIIPQIGDTETDAGLSFITVGEMISWLNSNWSLYGTWSTESVPGDFNEDFNNDFNKNVLKMVLTTANYNNAVVTITTV